MENLNNAYSHNGYREDIYKKVVDMTNFCDMPTVIRIVAESIESALTPIWSRSENQNQFTQEENRKILQTIHTGLNIMETFAELKELLQEEDILIRNKQHYEKDFCK